MKKILLTLPFFAAALLSVAQSPAADALWMRYPALSPDGQTIAFTYQGDIYTVPAKGGRALQITSNAAYDTNPIWSPDGKNIAFASDRLGSPDVFIVGHDGGTPTRLTTHSGSETPIAFKDDVTVLYAAGQMPTAQSIQFASNIFSQVYEVSIKGGRSKLFSTLPMEAISVSRNGKSFLFHDRKGYEDPWRKHQTSSIARDIWRMDLKGKGQSSYTRLTSFAGEDRNPVWATDGKAYYYLSEEKGTFNVFKRTLDGSKATQITQHTKHPVRFLTASNDGTLCYGFDGGIYTLKEGGKPQRVEIRIVTDKTDRDIIRQVRANGATDIALSPGEKEVAFILHGDVYVTSIEYATTKRITNTPQQERNLTFAPDGRSIVYSSERDGLWQIFQSSLVKASEKQFTYATEIKEEQLFKSKATAFQPQFSPDGKEIAYLENRTTLRVFNMKSKKVRTVMDGCFEYSYADGDQSFSWSPDSRWILSNYIGKGGWNNKDVALIDVTGKQPIVNLTESGYTDSNAKWALGGKAMLWKSDRAGYRSHGSWGAESDYYLMFFDLEAYERFHMNKEELALEEAAKQEEKKQNEAKKKTKPTDKQNEKAAEKDSAAKEKPEAVELDLDNRFDRIVRLTVNSSRLGDGVLTPKGDKLFYQAAFESGYDLWEQDLKESKTRIVMKNMGTGRLNIDKKGENFYVASNGLKKIAAGNGSAKEIRFEADFDHRPAEERNYIFDHAWQQVKDKFYMTNLHGVDWDYYRDSYRRLLPSINNNHDFAELLSELLGELNASHTGARYSAPNPAMPTATLGAFYDETYAGDGLLIEEIIAGSSFAVKNTGVTAGCIIESIDGTPIKVGEDYFPLLEGKANKKVRLNIFNPKQNKRFDVEVRAMSTGKQTKLLYKRWVKRNRAIVDSLSGGRIAYVHVEGMNSPSFREVYSELLSDKNRRKEAVIVDTRHNGGGWLHDDLVTLLGGKEYQQFVPRGQYIGSDPFNKWLKPSCLLVCEDNYSNASGFPAIYRKLEMGKIIGAPIPGTMTAVWWERQIDPTIVFGIPQVGVRDMDGVFGENTQLTPDIEVYNTPEEVASGIDRQLEAAVKAMLETIKK